MSVSYENRTVTEGEGEAIIRYIANKCEIVVVWQICVVDGVLPPRLSIQADNCKRHD